MNGLKADLSEDCSVESAIDWNSIEDGFSHQHSQNPHVLESQFLEYLSIPSDFVGSLFGITELEDSCLHTEQFLHCEMSVLSKETTSIFDGFICELNFDLFVEVNTP